MTDAAGRARADVDGAGALDAFEPGTNVLVVGERDGEALEFCLSRLAAREGPTGVVSTDVPAPSLASASRADPEGPVVRIVDCTGRPADADEFDLPRGTRAAVAGRDLPAVGEAAAATLADGVAPPVDGLCLDSVSTLVERATVQDVYKLLYVLAEQVRAGDAVAFYTWDGAADGKDVRILGRALDARVSLDAPDGPAVRSLDGRGGGDG